MKRIRLALILPLFLIAIPVRAAEPDRGVLVQGNTKFALELYGKLREKDGNLFVSPYSISSALAMTYAGARGKTADEMAKTLHFDLTNEKLHPAFGALIKEVN